MLLWMTLIFLASTPKGSSVQTYYLAKKILSLFDPAEALNATPDALAKVNFLIRKQAHVTEYFLLAFFIFRALRPTRFRPVSRTLIGAFIGVLYAASDEFHQVFVPGRTPAVHDVMIDSVGVMIATVFTLCLLTVHALDRKIAPKYV